MHFVRERVGGRARQLPAGRVADHRGTGQCWTANLAPANGDVVVTRDIAEENHLKVGDPVVLSDLRTGIPVEGTVRGIAYDTPNHHGDKIYYSVVTAQKLANGQPVVNTVIVNSDDAKAVAEKLDSSGWVVDWAAGRRDERPGTCGRSACAAQGSSGCW